MMEDGHVKIKPVLPWQKQHSTGRRLFTRKIDLNLRKNLVKCCICSIALYGAETWTLRKVYQKYMESFEMWCWRRTEISGTDRVRNEEVFYRVKEETNIPYTITRKKGE
jgi:hypothetical protein